jgi:hypothetical protein
MDFDTIDTTTHDGRKAVMEGLMKELCKVILYNCESKNPTVDIPAAVNAMIKLHHNL